MKQLNIKSDIHAAAKAWNSARLKIGQRKMTFETLQETLRNVQIPCSTYYVCEYVKNGILIRKDDHYWFTTSPVMYIRMNNILSNCREHLLVLRHQKLERDKQRAEQASIDNAIALLKSKGYVISKPN